MKVILAGRNGFLRVSLSIRSRSSDAVVWMVVNGAFLGSEEGDVNAFRQSSA